MPLLRDYRCKLVFCALAALCLLFVASCASNRQIPQGASRLVSTKIEVDSAAVQPSQLNPYLRQKGEGFIIFGVNPFKAQAVMILCLLGRASAICSIIWSAKGGIIPL